MQLIEHRETWGYDHALYSLVHTPEGIRVGVSSARVNWKGQVTPVHRPLGEAAPVVDTWEKAVAIVRTKLSQPERVALVYKRVRWGEGERDCPSAGHGVIWQRSVEGFTWSAMVRIGALKIHAESISPDWEAAVMAGRDALQRLKRQARDWALLRYRDGVGTDHIPTERDRHLQLLAVSAECHPEVVLEHLAQVHHLFGPCCQ